MEKSNLIKIKTEFVVVIHKKEMVIKNNLHVEHAQYIAPSNFYYPWYMTQQGMKQYK